MKPLHQLFLIALKDALIVVAAFTLYEIIEELKSEWTSKHPEKEGLHEHYGRLYHLISIFIADFSIGCLMYYLFNIVH
jgi:hypothetical protein